MYSPRPGYVPSSYWLPLFCLALVTLGFAYVGGYLLNYAIEAWNQGAVSISGRSGRVHTPTRAGDDWLLFYVWITYSVIAGLGIIGVAIYGFITSVPRRADE